MQRGILLVTVFSLLTLQPVQAHKLIMSLYPSGTAVEGEIGFSNGDMAADALVEVFDIDSKKIGEVKTDGEGFFTFEIKEGIRHIFRSNLGAGHVAQAILYEEDLPLTLRPATLAPSNLPSEEESVSKVTNLSEEQRAIIVAAVRQEVRPLKKELAAYKEKNDFQSILGGIGYIFGLCGIGFYFLARRKLKESQDVE